MSDEHPSFEALVDVVTGHQPYSADLATHLSACEHCQQELQSIRLLIAMLRDMADVEVPRALLEKLNALMRQRSAQPPRRRWLQAILLFDSLRQPVAAGVRSARSTTRQLVFDIDGCKLDLRIRTHLGRQHLSGQFLGYTGSPPEVRLQSDNDTLQATINELLVFEFPPVPERPHRLQIAFEDRGEVVINLEMYTQ